MYFVAEGPTPIFNTDKLKDLFHGPLQFDSRGLFAELEMIALRGTIFEVIRDKGNFVIEVKTDAYPTSYPIYIDTRFGKLQDRKPTAFRKKKRSTSQILEMMASAVDLPYVWGGNIRSGVPKMLEYYPPQTNYKLSQTEQYVWNFEGLDCSGLLYEATDGATPRNSSDLLFAGDGVLIEGMSPEEITETLLPGDCVVYRGHIFFILNGKEAIESKHGFGGVKINPIIERVSGFMEEEQKIPCNDPAVAYDDPSRFLVRRFVF